MVADSVYFNEHHIPHFSLCQASWHLIGGDAIFLLCYLFFSNSTLTCLFIYPSGDCQTLTTFFHLEWLKCCTADSLPSILATTIDSPGFYFLWVHLPFRQTKEVICHKHLGGLSPLPITISPPFQVLFTTCAFVCTSSSVSPSVISSASSTNIRAAIDLLIPDMGKTRSTVFHSCLMYYIRNEQTRSQNPGIDPFSWYTSRNGSSLVLSYLCFKFPCTILR